MSDRIRAKAIRVRVDKRSATLATAAAVGATQLLVKDAGDLAGDATVPGTLLVGDDSAALLKFTDVTFVEDTDPGDLTTPDTVKLAQPLTAAIDAGTELFAWETPDDGDTDGVVAEVIALCVPEDDQDASESGGPIRAIVPRGMQDDLPPGRADMPVVLEYDEDADEWSVLRLRGRGGGLKFEKDDFYALTAADIAAGTATIPLSHKPIDESVKLWWRTVAQEPTEYTVNATAKTITLPLGSFVASGDRVWVHYAYRVGLAKVTGPVGFTRVGSTMDHGSNWTSIAWPAGTQVGDVFVFAQMARTAAVNTCTDSRATLVASGTLRLDPSTVNTCKIWTGTVSNVSTPLAAAATDLGGAQEDVYGLFVLRPDSPISVDLARVGDSGEQGAGQIPGLSGSGSGAVGVGFSMAGIGGAASHSWASPWTFNASDQNGAYGRITFVTQTNPVVAATPAISTDPWHGYALGLTEG